MPGLANYHRQRALEEAHMAAMATSGVARIVHAKLAALHRRCVDEPQPVAADSDL